MSRRPPTRREFLGASARGSALLAFPTIVPNTFLFGGQALPPSRRITVAQIGCGRMGLEDMRGTMAHDRCRVVAVCDLDQKRLDAAKAEVVKYYQGKGESRVDVGAYRDYHEVLARKDVDAVIVTPPDHWHGLVAVEAALAGKDLYVQKPITYDIAEAIALRRVVRAKQRVLQTGSQQRSSKPWNTFRVASEAVRNGRIGDVRIVRIGIGQDQPKGVAPRPEPVPPTFDFDTWLGPAPQQPYMEWRVHPQDGYGRPGWITTEDFGLGMITNWGTHHVDIAQWALGMELSGPVDIEAVALFMADDVWTVHETYHVDMRFANGVRMVLDPAFTNGIRFEGTGGWVFCARGNARVTSSDPNAPVEDAARKSLDASDPRVLTAPYGPDAIRWAPSDDHYLNWLEAIEARKDPIAPVDQSVRSLETCAAGWIAMKRGRRLTWDPQAERFVGDEQAQALCARAPRAARYDVARVMKEAGLS